MLKSVRICSVFLCISILLSILFSAPISAATETVSYGKINGTGVNVRESASTSSRLIKQASNEDVFTVIQSVTGSDGYTWYKVKFLKDNQVGFVRNDLIKITATSVKGGDFDSQLSQFPATYHQALKALHEKYPNWIFVADKLTTSYDSALQNELVTFRKLVETSRGNSWKSMDPGTYDWQLSKWINNAGNWTGAAKELIAFYMDPRNALNTNAVSSKTLIGNIFMFLQQDYDAASQTKDRLRNVVKNTFLEKGYGGNADAYLDDLIEAAKATNISPFVLAAKIILEQGSAGESELISGASGYYNFFNIGASGSTHTDVVNNGIAYAKSKGWTTRKKSIVDGAANFSNGYLNVGQCTYFYEHYNVILQTYWHQYAQSVYAPVAEAGRITDVMLENADAPLVFRIPVYTSIPDQVAPQPAENANRNNYYLDSISAVGLSPAFSKSTQSYSLSVSGNTTLYAKPVSGATIVSETTKKLNAGKNTFNITVKSETGFTNTYTVTVSASTACTLSLAQKRLIGDTNNDGAITIVDLANVQKHLLGIKKLTGENFSYSDTNGDGSLTIVDLANIQKHLLGIKKLY